MFRRKAVLNRNLHSAAGQRKLSPEEEYARHDLGHDRHTTLFKHLY